MDGFQRMLDSIEHIENNLYALYIGTLKYLHSFCNLLNTHTIVANFTCSDQFIKRSKGFVLGIHS